jgi:protein PsiE
MKPKWAATLQRDIDDLAKGLGNLLVESFHYLALFAIGATIVWAAVHAFLGMAAKGQASIDDILLLFIYLELGAMVGIYFKTNHMPVRFLIYVGMTALTRLMISDLQDHHRPGMEVIYPTAAILVLALATLVIRYGSAKFPSTPGDEAAKR